MESKLNSQNDLSYVRRVFLSTVDGLYSVFMSLFYFAIGLLAYFRILSLPAGLGTGRDIAGLLLMPLLLLLVHLWHRSGVTLQKKLHFPSIIGVSAFAFLVPLIRTGLF